jgi:hypothetical protein
VVLSTLLMTDKPDYAPGSVVTFNGSGFQAGETIDLSIVSTNGTTTPLQAVDGGDGDLDGVADGSFTDTWNVGLDNVGATLTATATGESSGASATVTFTDSQLTGAIFTTNGDGTTVNLPFRTSRRHYL